MTIIVTKEQALAALGLQVGDEKLVPAAVQALTRRYAGTTRLYEIQKAALLLKEDETTTAWFLPRKAESFYNIELKPAEVLIGSFDSIEIGKVVWCRHDSRTVNSNKPKVKCRIIGSVGRSNKVICYKGIRVQ